MTEAAEVVKADLFGRLENGFWAGCEIEELLADIFGEGRVMGFGWDHYDCSLEIFLMEGIEADAQYWKIVGSEPVPPDFLATPSQAERVFAEIGCGQFWINFKDGTEQFCRRAYEYPKGTQIPLHVGKRTASSTQRWKSKNEGGDRLHVVRREALRLREALEAVLPYSDSLLPEIAKQARDALNPLHHQGASE